MPNKYELKEVSKCKNVEEVLKLAKDNNYEISKEKAEELFNSTHTNGELTDSELNSVSGGSCTNAPDKSSMMEVEYFSDDNLSHCIFQVGQEVKFDQFGYNGCKHQAKIVKITSVCMLKDPEKSMMRRPPWHDCYWVEADNKKKDGPFNRSHFYKTL